MGELHTARRAVDGRTFRPSGLTVMHSGTVLLDSDGRNGYSNRAVLIAVVRPSKVSLVWSAATSG